jgi:hypothetical protein
MEAATYRFDYDEELTPRDSSTDEQPGDAHPIPMAETVALFSLETFRIALTTDMTWSVMLCIALIFPQTRTICYVSILHLHLRHSPSDITSRIRKGTTAHSGKA